MRLIDADALPYDEFLNHRIVMWEDIERSKTIDAVPVRHGHWIKMSDADGHYYACSECGEELYREWSFDREYDLFPKKKTIDKTHYCPNCGYKMDLNEVEK